MIDITRYFRRMKCTPPWNFGVRLWKLIYLTPHDVAHALSNLDLGSAPAVMVHSSLSRCGYIEGGRDTVIDALQGWAGPRTLAMPTHSYCYPDILGGPAACFDPRQTPSQVGLITDLFWRMPGVVRSLHPSHSLAAIGPRAEELCRNHDRTPTPCGLGTPYARLVEWDAAVLMFGASMSAYTLFHTAEDAARVPYLYKSEPTELRYRGANRVTWSFDSRRQDVDVPRRFGEVDDWLEVRGLLRRVRFGEGELLWIPRCRPVHELLLERLRHEPLFLVDRSR